MPSTQPDKYPASRDIKCTKDGNGHDCNHGEIEESVAIPTDENMIENLHHEYCRAKRQQVDRKAGRCDTEECGADPLAQIRLKLLGLPWFGVTRRRCTGTPKP